MGAWTAALPPPNLKVGMTDKYDHFLPEIDKLAREFREFRKSEIMSVVQRVGFDEARRMLEISHRNHTGLAVIHAAIDIMDKDRKLLIDRILELGGPL
jgi:hypothetical protein